MLNQTILEILKKIQADNPQIFLNSGRVAAFLKDLTANDSQYNAVIRWIEISLADFDAYARIKDDYLKNHDFARPGIYESLLNEGASPEIAKEVIGYWSELAGFAPESVAGVEDDLEAGAAYLNADDIVNAKACLTRASSGGNPRALYKLCGCYIEERNMYKAFEYCKKAAEAKVSDWPEEKESIANAQYELALFYARGEDGVAENPKEEFRWIAQAGINGHLEALGRTGYYLAVGTGVEQDEAKGLAILERAVNLGDEKALARISEIWLNKAIQTKDDVKAVDKAIYWLSAQLEKGAFADDTMKNGLEMGLTALKDKKKQLVSAKRASLLGVTHDTDRIVREEARPPVSEPPSPAKVEPPKPKPQINITPTFRNFHAEMDEANRELKHNAEMAGILTQRGNLNMADHYLIEGAEQMQRLEWISELQKLKYAVQNKMENYADPSECFAEIMQMGYESLQEATPQFREMGDVIFQEILRKDPLYCDAHVGRLCAEMSVKSEQELTGSTRKLDDSEHYKNALKCADAEYRIKLEGYNNSEHKNNNSEHGNNRYDELIAQWKELESNARKGTGNYSEKLRLLAKAFQQLNYRDSHEQANMVFRLVDTLEKERANAERKHEEEQREFERIRAVRLESEQREIQRKRDEEQRERERTLSYKVSTFFNRIKTGAASIINKVSDIAKRIPLKGILFTVGMVIIAFNAYSVYAVHRSVATFQQRWFIIAFAVSFAMFSILVFPFAVLWEQCFSKTRGVVLSVMSILATGFWASIPLLMTMSHIERGGRHISGTIWDRRWIPLDIPVWLSVLTQGWLPLIYLAIFATILFILFGMRVKNGDF
ncbi:MAG: hypothetical protein FWC70_05320 [Defluviitaleaceae bacterium]|nr:hypothetical protein [Defluviitaleaceae bacterium]